MRRRVMAGRDHLRARGRTAPRVRGSMNRTEAAYSVVLEAQRRQGEIAVWRFEAVKLRLADNTWYTPDFLILDPDGFVTLVEIKPGSPAGPIWTPDSRIKWKVAAEAYPEFRFRVAWTHRKAWYAEGADRAAVGATNALDS